MISNIINKSHSCRLLRDPHEGFYMLPYFFRGAYQAASVMVMESFDASSFHSPSNRTP